ncbi:MAG: TetR/AcrR family transcriptional regulator [Ignavibacteria bacterium]|nr:TetR/AcrR family transcriptional regulator [Ignavibacteria bacterium]
MDKKVIKPDKDTEKRILDSARKIFHKKGLAGARMQEIADDAGINKAMLHYYYRSKEKLFSAVFQEAAERIFPEVSKILGSELPLFEKIKVLIENYIEMLKQNMYLPIFILHEIQQDPSRLVNIIMEDESKAFMKFFQDIEKAKAEGIIINTDIKTVIVNILSLCIFPVAAKPVISGIFNIRENEYMDYLESRKKSVTEFVIKAIKK